MGGKERGGGETDREAERRGREREERGERETERKRTENFFLLHQERYIWDS